MLISVFKLKLKFKLSLSKVNTFMNVAIDMIFWFDSLLYRLQQVHAPCTHACAAEVPEAKGRGVGDEDVGVCRDVVPPLEALGPPREVEGPTTELRLPRGP